jgi:hypothetical protein
MNIVFASSFFGITSYYIKNFGVQTLETYSFGGDLLYIYRSFIESCIRDTCFLGGGL